MSRTHSGTEFGQFSGPASARPAKLSLSALWSLLMNWQQRISDREHLTRLTDRELADVGLTRADISAEIRKPFWLA